MSVILKEFKDCLDSNLSCDEINEKMKSISKYKINQSLTEENIFDFILQIFQKYFFDELVSLSLNNKDGQIKFSHENLFKICHQIVTKKEKYKENELYSNIELFYKTFYFLEINTDNETNDFTFFYQCYDGSLISKDIEIYLYNIGDIILNEKSDSNFIEILFSEVTPSFLVEIILTCVEYTRFTKKNVSDFINLCIPYLNHFNLFYLNETLYKECNYQIPFKGCLSYINFENFIKDLNQNKSGLIDEENKDNFFNITQDSNEIILKENITEDEKTKYFNLNDEGNKNCNFFTDITIKKNKDKFIEMVNSKGESKYKIVYDISEMDDNTVNAFSFGYLLKHNIIKAIDKHFFQIFNSGNIKVELFSKILLKYLDLINKLLTGSLSKEQKLELFSNSGFYGYNNEYLLLMSIKEEDQKIFYLKNGLTNGKITTFNNDIDYKVYQVIKSEYSSIVLTTRNIYYYDENNDEGVLYNFDNYSFGNNLTLFIQNFINENKDIYELPRLYASLNHCIPVEKNKFQFITNVKSEIYNKSYGYGVLDFVLKNNSDNDIIIQNEELPYKERIFMAFPCSNKTINNNQKIVLKKKSIAFFEFKSTFPQYKWKDNFTHIFKNIAKFIEIYKKRGVYNKEYIQIYFIYDNIPQLYYEQNIKNYIDSNFKELFGNFEFGLYYFNTGINIITNQILEKKITDLDDKINKILEILKNLNNKEINEELEKNFPIKKKK